MTDERPSEGAAGPGDDHPFGWLPYAEAKHRGRRAKPGPTPPASPAVSPVPMPTPPVADAPELAAGVDPASATTREKTRVVLPEPSTPRLPRRSRGWGVVLGVIAVVALLLAAISLLGKTLLGDDDPAGGTVAGATTFTADSYQAVAEVCDGRGMSNAAAWDPATARVFAFVTGSAAPGWSSVLIGPEAGWAGNAKRFEKVSLVACLTADRAGATPKKRCVTKTADGNRAKVRVHRTTYDVVLREARTAAVLGDGQTVVVPGTICPTLVTGAGDFFPPPSFVQADPVIEEFLAAQGAAAK